MNRKALYLIGPPGVGKSTVMRHIVSRMADAVSTQEKPFAHRILYHAGQVVGCELGVQRDAFSGTDGLSMNVMPKAMAFVKEQPFPVLLAEGDRLASVKFFGALKEAGYETHIVSLEVSDRVQDARRRQRAHRLNAEAQNEPWVRGRITKAARLADATATYRVDATSAPFQLAPLIMQEVGLV